MNRQGTPFQGHRRWRRKRGGGRRRAHSRRYAWRVRDEDGFVGLLIDLFNQGSPVAAKVDTWCAGHRHRYSGIADLNARTIAEKPSTSATLRFRPRGLSKPQKRQRWCRSTGSSFFIYLLSAKRWWGWHWAAAPWKWKRTGRRIADNGFDKIWNSLVYRKKNNDVCPISRHLLFIKISILSNLKKSNFDNYI